MKMFVCSDCGNYYWGETEYNFYPICPDCLDAFVMPDPLVESLGFPELQGTKKQIEWAITLREKAFKKYSKNQRTKFTLDNFKTEPLATWWIENR